MVDGGNGGEEVGPQALIESPIPSAASCFIDVKRCCSAIQVPLNTACTTGEAECGKGYLNGSSQELEGASCTGYDVRRIPEAEKKRKIGWRTAVVIQRNFWKIERRYLEKQFAALSSGTLVLDVPSVCVHLP
jgi:hypothetical protein